MNDHNLHVEAMIGHTPHTVTMRELVLALGTRRVQTDRQITADMLVEPLNDTITFKL